MADELSFYQIKPNKCEVAQANLMVELMNFKNKQLMPIPSTLLLIWNESTINK